MSDGIRDGFRNPLVTGVSIPDGTIDTQHIADGAVSSTKIDTNLQSDNYDGGVIGSNPGTVGWRIERNTGDAVFNDVVVRGEIQATSGSIEGTLSMGASGSIEFARGSTAVITTNDNPQSGDVWIEYRGNDAGAIIGLRDFGGGTQLVVAQMEVSADGFEITQGQFLLDAGNSAAVPDLAWGLDSDTGIFRNTTNSIAFSTAGSIAMQIGTTNVNFPVFGGTTGGASINHTGFGSSSPPYQFIGDGDTGMYRAGADTIGFVTGGSGPDVLITPAGSVQARFNDASGPAFSFHSDPDTGIYRKTTNDLGISAGGTVAHWAGNTTTNSGLASWRHNSFGGGSTFEFLPLVSSEQFKSGIRDLTVRRAKQILGMYRPREWKSKAPADPKNVWLPGFVVEESPKTPKDLIAPLLVVVAELQSRVTELEEAA